MPGVANLVPFMIAVCVCVHACMDECTRACLHVCVCVCVGGCLCVCRKRSPLELTEGNMQITDGKMMQRDAKEHAPHWTTRRDKTNQQQKLHNKKVNNRTTIHTAYNTLQQW